MKLAELERYFSQTATASGGPPTDLDSVFKGSPALPPHERMAIYNRAYYYRQLEALASVFEETKQALGDARFERCGLAYLTLFPSEHPAIERVGRHFPAYLLTLADVTPDVRTLAALEWARLCALVAANPRTVASVSEIDLPRFPSTRLHFVPSLQVLPQVAVWRPAHHVLSVPLSALDFAALGAAVAGSTMAEVCAHFDGEAAEAAGRAFEIVAHWFERQWIERLELS